MTKRFSIASLVLGGICLASISHADTATFNFATTDHAVGSAQKTYSAVESATYTIGAHGYKVSDGSDALLYEKNNGNNETGLGLVMDLGSDHEIDTNHIIQLDTNTLTSLGFTNLTFKIGSAQALEGYQIWGSNTAGQRGTSVALFNNPNGSNTALTNTQALGTYRYYSLEAVDGDGHHATANIILENGTYASTPEASSLALLLPGLIPVGVALRRRAKKA